MELSKREKTVGAAALAALIGVLGSLKSCVEEPEVSPSPSPSVEVSGSPVPGPSVSASPSSSPSPSPSPSSVPSVGPSSGTLVLDSWEKPEWAASSAWKASSTRTLLDGQVTSFVLKSDSPCGLVGVAGIQKMLPVVTKTPSAPSYQVGTYYDALVPLTASNCAGTKYLQLDASQSIVVGGASLNVIRKVTKAPVTPKVPLHIEFNNWVMVQRYCGGSWCQSTPAIETFGKQGASMLTAHRISPYKSWPGGGYSWAEYQGDLVLGGPAFIAYGDVPSSLTPFPLSSLGSKAWAYVHDEPRTESMGEVATKLANWKARAPSVRRMLTTSIRYRDTIAASSTFGKIIDLPPAVLADTQIFTPVAEALCVETWKGSGDFYPCADAYKAAQKELWGYVSNMSHGADGGSATGAPDLVIDRSAVEAFGFFLMALKYDMSGLLYYNSIEGWQNASVDLVANPYIFGGNGDGLLLYPDKVGKKAEASIRLKLLREASQWLDVIKLAGKQGVAGALMTNPLVWQRDLAAFEALHRDAMSAL